MRGLGTYLLVRYRLEAAQLTQLYFLRLKPRSPPSPFVLLPPQKLSFRLTSSHSHLYRKSKATTLILIPHLSSLANCLKSNTVFNSIANIITRPLKLFFGPSHHTHSPPIFPNSHSHLVKLDSRDTPPPLHFSPAVSDRERSSTAETTPIGTPRGFSATLPRKADKEKENWLAWHHKHSGFGGSSYVDSALLESDFEDTTFPLFNDPPPFLNMASRTTPIDIASPSHAASPRSTQTSNLTSALQSTSGNEARPTTAMDLSGTPFKGYGGFGGATPGSQYSGAQPISVSASSSREKPRRESLASSMVTGMSWGGNSVGSWIRDEYVST